MSADISQSPVPTLTEGAWALLHDLRLRGFRPAKGTPAEEELTAAGLVLVRGVNLALAPAGRQAHAAWARLTPDSEEEVLAKTTYERFLVFNVEFLRICTDWQLKPGNQPTTTPTPPTTSRSWSGSTGSTSGPGPWWRPWARPCPASPTTGGV